jgi:hypothetical protein
MSAQLELSEEVFCDRMDALLEAFMKKDHDKVKEISRTIPLTPEVALQRRSYMSKEDIVELGFDMSLVEAKLGKDWYEES